MTPDLKDHQGQGPQGHAQRRPSGGLLSRALPWWTCCQNLRLSQWTCQPARRLPSTLRGCILSCRASHHAVTFRR